MAIAQLQLPSYQINNTVDQAQWNTLGNLGNVYSDAQAAAAKRAALASLGDDPQANLHTLLSSGDPALAQLGLNLQQKGIEQAREDVRYKVTDARANAQLAIQQAAAKRAQEDWLQAEKDQQNAAKLIGGFFPGATPPAAPAAPFPAPLPGAMPPTAPPTAPSPTAPPVAATPPVAQPSAFEATPTVPSTLQPPIKAEGDASELPSWAGAQSMVGRIANNLTSPAPAAAAGVSRDQLAALYANPLTRPLATAFLQKQLSPGEWKYEKMDDGRIIAVNSLDPTKTKDVTPPTPTGEPPVSKQQREVQGYFQAGKNLGMSDQEATAFAANKGKTPKQDLNPTEEKAVLENTKQIHAGEDVISNLHRLQQLSKTAWSGYGAGTAATIAGAVLPAGMVPQGATDTTELQNVALQNVARQAKETFGARLAVAEVKLLNEIETNPLQSDQARQRIYTRLEEMFQRHLKDVTAENDQIRNKTFFKPGGGGTPQAPAAGATDPLGLR
jgi:hypothetical protein